ncbi:conserved exported protein of unknown function [Rhodovastum atsumiense]|uniref:Uncharacterized protein n=1 Tax=Rhodovastum atsumiense TaxID=504468 RepID=A0A5M6IWU1_9PROT|nr:iron transporter [Rhodovastum atsumiense]KAA5612783.1 hypothetical protein F1189_08590 [Rhodovastum atsumiense]CAH2602646.1 conserved exported protein of unknown function [Rhodovastum atsumiense]
MRFFLQMMRSLFICCLIVLAASQGNATQMKLNDGHTVKRNGMVIAADYIQPVTLDRGAASSETADIYFQLYINAMANNPLGFFRQSWIPYLGVTYKLSRPDSNWQAVGRLEPAIANYGPHYGANVKLNGVGTYQVVVRVTPPEEGVYRHISRETGVTWWEPFEISWTFTYLGIGKRGAIGGSGGY